MKGKIDFELPQEVLGLYQDLVQVIDRHSDIQIGLGMMSKENIEDHLSQGVPIISFISPVIHKQAFITVAEEIVDVIKKYQPTVTKKIEKILEYFRKIDDLHAFVDPLLWQEEGKLEKLIVGNRLDKKLFFFLMINTLRPFMISYGKKVSVYTSNESWKRSFCPVCGWSPVMAKITSDEHKRLLHCSMCSTEWEYKRMACTKCGNDDHETVRYFKVEGDEAYQFLTCEKCKSYLKAIDESKTFEKLNMLYADIKTLYLDLIAEREGYNKEAIFKEASN